MPQRIELTELQTGTIAGVPFSVAHSRDKRLVAFVATYDGDGLMESEDDCRRAARRLRAKLDSAAASRHDSG